MFGFGGVAVYSNLGSFDEELDAGAGDVGESLREVEVKAKVGGGRVGSEGAESRGVGLFFDFVELEDGNWGWGGLFDSAGGTVLVLYGAAALALGEHVLRRHG